MEADIPQPDPTDAESRLGERHREPHASGDRQLPVGLLHASKRALRLTSDDRIMIVGDDLRVAEVTRKHLMDAGCRDHVTCIRMARAVTLIRAESPDLVLLEVARPELFGLEVLAEIRATAVPVVVVTAADDRRARVKALELGATYFVSKPIEPLELLTHVHNALAVKRHSEMMQDYAEELESKVSETAKTWRDQAISAKASNQALTEANVVAQAAVRAKSEFLANMSHEIRTPLTAILGYAEVLHEEEDSSTAPPKRVEALDTLLRNGKHLLKIVDEVLDLAKIEAGHLEIEHIRCSPAELAAEVIQLMKGQADAKGLGLAAEWVGRIPKWIHTDPTRLKQVLINLLGNAVKFTESGSVRLAVRLLDRDLADPLLQFEVIDSGVGIAPETLEGLFEPFNQADNSVTRKHGGTGLGLTICKWMAERLGGSVSAESVPGRGSTFRATIATGSLEGIEMLDQQAAAKADEARGARRTQPAPTTEHLDGRVLLAEDAPDTQRLISFLLKKAGAEVTVADNGQIAYEKAIEAHRVGEPFDLILMDIQMPVLDGLSATQKLRKDGYTNPICALTAHALPGERERCIQAGCDDFATKPISRGLLIATVARHTDSTAVTAEPVCAAENDDSE